MRISTTLLIAMLSTVSLATAAAAEEHPATPLEHWCEAAGLTHTLGMFS